MSDLEQFDKILKELHELKPPGVSGSRIKAINNIAIKQVQNESILITKLYSACRASPSSNKLGMLYVVDIILRSYNDEAKKHGEIISSESPEGTFGAGIYKINELIESILDDALEFTIDKTTINKILKLIEVWERSKSFDEQFIKHLKSKYFKSTSPPGTPPPRISELVYEQPKPSTTSNVLLALDNLQKLSSKSPTPTNAPVNANNILSQLSNLSGNIVSNAPVPSTQQSNSVLDMLSNLSNQSQPPSMGADYSRRDRSRSPHRDDNNVRERSPPRRSGLPKKLPASLPAIPKSLPAIPRKVAPEPSYQPPPQQQPQQPQNFNSPSLPQIPGLPNVPKPVDEALATVDVNGFEELNVESNPHFRPRNVGIDSSIPNDSIKVFSRTLFFGGVTREMTEQYIVEVLRPFGEVQSIILNTERKHAFVKVYSRREAENIVNSFNKDNFLPLRIRWGVGFGPRDCCDYQHGVSIIPIARLTDSDKLWIEKGQWGGTGGQPVTSGLVIDEPDIEASTGVSSKSMSKKMPTNSGRNGPKSGLNPDSLDYNYTNNFNGNTNNFNFNGIPPSSGNPNLEALNSLLNQQK